MTDFKETEFKYEEQDAQLPANTRSIASDIAQASDNRDLLTGMPLGTPNADYDVRSIYDSRPINSYDFNIAINNIDPDGGALWPGNQFDFGFVVPAGYVAVLKKLHHSFDPPPVITSRKDVTATFLINGSLYQRGVTIVAVGTNPQPGLANIPIGLESDDILEAFVIADENQTVGARIKVSAAIAATEAVCYVHLYGQLLLKTGRPAQFEPANKVGSSNMGSSIYTPSVPVEMPTPQEPKVVERIVERVVEVQAPPPPEAPLSRSLRPAGSSGRTPIIDRRTGRIVGYR